MSLYHYTERLSAADIVAAGVIRPSPQVLHRDALARDAGYPTPALSWLTTRPEIDPVILSKMRLAGWPDDPTGNVVRFTIADTYPVVSLSPDSPTVGADPEWWEWVVRTGAMVGSHWQDWRIGTTEIPAAMWEAVERLVGTAPDRWEALR